MSKQWGKEDILVFLKKEMILIISFLAAIISCFFNTPSGEYLTFIDFKVLSCLFCLMAVVQGLTEENIFYIIADKMIALCHNFRMLAFAVIALTFFSSMFITNDVALLTFVPLTIILTADCLSVKQIIPFVVLQTLAANLGSMLTPIGNPQNLYLFTFYQLSFGAFFKIIAPVVAFAAVLLCCGVLMIPKQKILVKNKREEKYCFHGGKLFLYFMWFLFSILAVFRQIPYIFCFLLVLITLLLWNPKLLKKIDYSLLLTFIAFFIFAGNLAEIPQVKEFLYAVMNKNALLVSAFTSQFMSNVPAAIFLSAFSEEYIGLLLGVNIGGCGTLIASLASVISYKLFLTCYPKENLSYLGQFTIWNLLFLVILMVFVSCFKTC